MRAPASGWTRAELLAQRHEPGHLVLGETQLVAPGFGERQVADLERQDGRAGGGGHVNHSRSTQPCGRKPLDETPPLGVARAPSRCHNAHPLTQRCHNAHPLTP